VVQDLSLAAFRRAAAGFAGVYTLEYAQAAKVFESDLELADTGGSSDEARVQAGVVFFFGSCRSG